MAKPVKMRHGPFRADLIAEYPAVIGCDEVGYGAMAGPVLVAACFFDVAAIPADLLEALDDSKKLTPLRRATLEPQIRAYTRIMVASSSARLVDRIGLRPATFQAMRRAILGLGIKAEVVCDGTDYPANLGLQVRCTPKADGTVPQVAAASIVAKEVRDRLMRKLHIQHPHYGWDGNVGYAAAVHMASLSSRGPSPHHRMSYAPVREAIMARSGPPPTDLFGLRL